jgi:hypothetical protein
VRVTVITQLLPSPIKHGSAINLTHTSIRPREPRDHATRVLIDP